MFFVDWNSCDTNKLFVCIGVVGLGGSICLDPPEAFNAKNPDRFLCLGEPSPEPAEAPGGRAAMVLADASGLLLLTGGVGTSKATGERLWNCWRWSVEPLLSVLLVLLLVLAPCETDFLVKGETGI